ncbi:MAG: pyridoxal phosphate-dependent aminotransferase, partial [Candidatus Woesearchaeota archaeon]
IAKLLEKYNLYCIYDADVFFTSYDDTDPLIPLKVDSFSKRTIFLFTMTKELGSPGLRISWGIGPKKLIQKLKNFQKISLEILPPPNKFLVEKILKNVNVERVKKILKERMEILVKGIKKLGWKIEKPSFGVNLFIPVPLNFKKLKRTNPDSVFSYYLAKKTKILVRTGSSHGNKKYDTVRFVISQKKEIIKEAIERMKKENISYNMYLPKEIEEEFINEIITCK